MKTKEWIRWLLAVSPMVVVCGCRTAPALGEAPDPPMVPVSCTIDLMAEGRALLEPFSIMTVTEPRRTSDRLGVAGLLVVHTDASFGDGNGYAAFDLACPYEWPSVVALQVGQSGTMEAVCPKCGTVYDLTFGAGLPKEGKSSYPLWQYRVTVRDTFLEITNNGYFGH